MNISSVIAILENIVFLVLNYKKYIGEKIAFKGENEKGGFINKSERTIIVYQFVNAD